MMHPAGRMRILMGLFKCGLNNNLEHDLSIVFEGQRGKGTEALSYKRVRLQVHFHCMSLHRDRIQWVEDVLFIID